MTTDGEVSFALLIFDDPDTLISYHGDAAKIGFDAGEDGAFADIMNLIHNSNFTLEAVNIFRIDG